jgi:GNAT superfamily N-acetyltransferase
MSNQLNDPMPILLTDRLSTASAGAALRIVDAGADPDAGHAGADASNEGTPSAAPAIAPRLLDSALGSLLLRPLVAADAAALADFLQALGEHGRRMRGFALPSGHCATQLRLSLTPVPAPVWTRAETEPAARLLGELCVSIDRSRVVAEFALAVRPALHGYGLGRLLVHCLLDLCLLRRVTLACASVPTGSPAMLALAHGCGFQILRAADGSAQLALMLRPRGVR